LLSDGKLWVVLLLISGWKNGAAAAAHIKVIELISDVLNPQT
jgi:hypothetical protein